MPKELKMKLVNSINGRFTIFYDLSIFKNRLKDRQMKFKGIGVSGNITVGTVFLYLQESYTIPKYDIEDTDAEITRLRSAIDHTIEEINRIKDSLADDISKEDLLMYTSFVLFLQDQSFYEMIVGELLKGKKNVEWVLYLVLEELIEKFKNLPNDFFQQRSEDISALGEKLMMNLLKRSNSDIFSLPENAIVIGRSVSPTDPIMMKKKAIVGLVTELGGYASHTAIMVRSLNIPAVLGVEFISSEAQNGDAIIINPLKGEVILRPTEEQLKTALAQKSKVDKFEHALNKFKNVPAITGDGVPISVLANIEYVDELISLKGTSAKGVGLFRSEFLVLQSNTFPSEENQYKEYRRIFEVLGNELEVTIRTLDLGGDKIIPGYASANEKNPFLGWRAIRFCLARESLFKEQLKAIVRAGHGAKTLKIMVPMVATLEEVLKTKEILAAIEAELKLDGVEYNAQYKFGIMLEIPSVYHILDDLAGAVDFISIGTNDLIQYLLACDRGNEKVAYLFRYSSPSVLRFLTDVIRKSAKLGIEVSMCGEMASDIISTPLLLGMGLRRFSISPIYIPLVNRIAAKLSVGECEVLLERVLKLSTANDIEHAVMEWLKARVPDIVENKIVSGSAE